MQTQERAGYPKILSVDRLQTSGFRWRPKRRPDGVTGSPAPLDEAAQPMRLPFLQVDSTGGLTISQGTSPSTVRPEPDWPSDQPATHPHFFQQTESARFKPKDEFTTSHSNSGEKRRSPPNKCCTWSTSSRTSGPLLNLNAHMPFASVSV